MREQYDINTGTNITVSQYYSYNFKLCYFEMSV